jgi:1-acyl-sn-glycerol-3-phosphate acyltransferase
MNLIRNTGELLGRTVGKVGREYLQRRVENFEISFVGSENLEGLKDTSYLAASNHLKPEEQMSSESGISPDAFIISKLIKEITGQELKIVQKSDNGWWADSAFSRFIQKKIGQPLGRGFSSGVGNIPIQKNPGSSNKEFLKIIKKTVEEDKDPILIFPEGNWYPDFDLSHTIQPGAAHLAKFYGLMVVPIYIKGATSWRPRQKVIVSFGKPFSTEGLSKEEVTQRIGIEISLLQQGVKEQN